MQNLTTPCKEKYIHVSIYLPFKGLYAYISLSPERTGGRLQLVAMVLPWLDSMGLNNILAGFYRLGSPITIL